MGRLGAAPSRPSPKPLFLPTPIHYCIPMGAARENGCRVAFRGLRYGLRCFVLRLRPRSSLLVRRRRRRLRPVSASLQWDGACTRSPALSHRPPSSSFPSSLLAVYAHPLKATLQPFPSRQWGCPKPHPQTPSRLRQVLRTSRPISGRGYTPAVSDNTKASRLRRFWNVRVLHPPALRAGGAWLDEPAAHAHFCRFAASTSYKNY